MGIKVTLREKFISKGRKSLYLDFYPAILDQSTGKYTRRQFLGLYILEKPKDGLDKAHNQDTLKLGKQIMYMRHNELNKPEIYDEFEKDKIRLKKMGEADFIEYFKKQMRLRKDSNSGNWKATLRYLNNFTNGKLTFRDINISFLEEFKHYLLNTKSIKSDKVYLSQNSASSYFSKVKNALKQANKEGIIDVNWDEQVDGIKRLSTRRPFLTLEEVNQLVKTKCEDSQLRSAAIYSMLTGTRFSDIRNLKWEDIEKDGRSYYVNFRHKKTMQFQRLPINEQAYNLLLSQERNGEFVFSGLKYSDKINTIIKSWMKSASINKYLTFHGFRHTFASLLIDSGTHMKITSELLGHSKVSTTEIYTHNKDMRLVEAVNRIKIEL